MNKIGKPPLFVDLDDTLLLGDSLWECFVLLARHNFFIALISIFKLLRGRAAFKHYVFRQDLISPCALQYNQDVLSFVNKETAEGRLVVLATAADYRFANNVAEHLKCFAHVIACDGTTNLKGTKKLSAITAYTEEKTGKCEFDYIGDCRADRPIWAACKNAIVVAYDQTAAQKIIGKKKPTLFLCKPKNTWRDIITELRIHQWAKNVLIFTPLLLSHQYTDLQKVINAFIGFIAFGLCASATYIWNDILDISSDRMHPRKKSRPIAAGRIGISQGFKLSLLLVAMSFGVSLISFSTVVIALLGGYILLTLIYSLYLKEKLLADAMMLGLLFAYRIFFGGIITKIAVSDWLIAFSVFFFLGLALVKRYAEIASRLPDKNGKISGRGYYSGDREVVGVIGIASSFMSVLILALYITSPAVTVLYKNPKILWGVSFVMIYWISRIWVLSHRGHMSDDPIVFALHDKVSIFAGAACSLFLTLAKL